MLWWVDGLGSNMDIQPVFNHDKAVAFMCAYFSKSENKSSVVMKQAVRDAFGKISRCDIC